ncbi:DUF4398 domain-containing protein [Entomomonas sp. E2T0]|uniref:DUF4398 domain-containing protein n=1 Tax=Entomomonas sp. E2T0 TaxID=2930213 RepID=UPI0022284615|nr:DUF4398 domain-containing protein [Entomomonas sp. E2T0]UYZ84964.1 DUF4398 domain-containing protein [Entomomonas sp. E2T0]
MTLFSKSKLALGGVILAGGVLAGCAGNPPTAQMDVARLAVNNAVGAGATQFAPADMQTAQEHFRKARVAMEEKDFKAAKIYAERAEWDARVAERRAQVEKMKYVDPKALTPTDAPVQPVTNAIPPANVN